MLNFTFIPHIPEDANVWLMIGQPADTTSWGRISAVCSAGTVNISTTNSAGVPTDGILSKVPIEVRFYPSIP